MRKHIKYVYVLVLKHLPQYMYYDLLLVFLWRLRFRRPLAGLKKWVSIMQTLQTWKVNALRVLFSGNCDLVMVPKFFNEYKKMDI